MNKVDLINALAETTGLQKKETRQVLEAYMSIVTDCMRRKEKIILIGFGTFIPKNQKSRLARNPKTGEPVTIKPRTTVKFKPGKDLLDTVNGANESV